MFNEPLPEMSTPIRPGSSAGLGTIARVVATGAEIYRQRLELRRGRTADHGTHRPYHDALSRLLDETSAAFGCYLLVDCHSMPSIGGPTDCDAGATRVDFVLGDCFGSTCAPLVADLAEAA